MVPRRELGENERQKNLYLREAVLFIVFDILDGAVLITSKDNKKDSGANN